MKINDTQKKYQFENILPMVNVVFLLLIFFMVAGAYSSPEMFEVSSPKSTSTLYADPTKITILVDQSGRIAIGETELTHDNLVDFLRLQINANPDQIIQLKADADVEALEIVTLIELLSETKLNRVHLLTTSSS
jgi:biopolymer transport protein ExbD